MLKIVVKFGVAIYVAQAVMGIAVGLYFGDEVNAILWHVVEKLDVAY